MTSMRKHFVNVEHFINVESLFPDMAISTPHFTGQSFLSLPTLTNAYSDLQLSVEFKPESPNGILILTGETADMTGDYLTLLLRDGHVELRSVVANG